MLAWTQTLRKLKAFGKPVSTIMGELWSVLLRPLIKAMLWLVVLVWLGCIFCCPLQKVRDKNDLAALDKPLAAVMAALRTRLPHATEIRLEPRKGSNLRIYLLQSSFETVLYPDRGDFVKAVGKAWCDDPGVGRTFLPSVKICDIRTGDELASYNCVLTW